MPTLICGGYRIWFDTDDAPAPSGTLPHGGEVPVCVGVSPADPELIITVRYRRQGGAWMSLPMQARPREGSETPSYYDSVFRNLAPGSVIEYTVQCQHHGRPLEPTEAKTLKFELKGVARPSRRSVTPTRQPGTSAPGSAPAKKIEAQPHTASTLPSEPSPSTGGSALKPEKLLGLTEGAPTESDADRLAVASVALHVADGDEAAARKVMSALEGRGVRKPQDLAALTAEEIASTLERAGATGLDTVADKAAKLRAAVGKAFPTETLMRARLPVSPSSTTKASPSITAAKPEVIDRIWKANAGLDLLRMDLSRNSDDRKRLKLEGLQPSEKKAFIRDVQLRKGALRAAGNASIAESLLKKGLTSPASMSPARLATETGTSLARATTIHQRDIQHYGRLSNGLFALWDALRGGLQDTAVGNLRRAKVTEFFDGLDNIQELFGDQDSCDCKHCNSVLGPAAYFVDLMHFVQAHVLEETFKDHPNHPLHLKTRRPDLGVLPLTCENTHTEIPQLQITSEIFENFIAAKRGKAIQPDRKSVVSSVYGEFLPSGRHSVLQPFHLPLEELEIYLSHFKLRRSDIAQLLDEPEEIQLRAALSISGVHAELITIPDASAVNIHNKLGLTLPPDGVVPMKQLLTATQLPRGELGDLLESRFVSGSQPLTISAEKKTAESVQFDIERVRGVTLTHLDRIHRILRLRRYLPWSPKELDGFIAAVGGDLNANTLGDAARALTLQRRFGASIGELCALAGDLPDLSVQKRTGQEGDKRTPIDILFNVPDLVREDGAYPSQVARYSAGATSNVAKERSMRLRAGLRLDDGDLNALVEGLAQAFEQGAGGNDSNVLKRLFTRRLRDDRRFASPPLAAPIDPKPLPVPVGSDPSFPLTRRNLSLLYRHAVLARWLKLNPTDLLTLIRLTPGIGNHLTSIADSVSVIRIYDWWKSTPLSIQDLSILLAPREAIREQVDALWKALQAWLAEQQPMTIANTFLTQVDGVSEDLSREILELNKGKVFEAIEDGYRVLATWRDDNALDVSPASGAGLNREAIRELVRSQHPDARLPRALTEALEVNIELARAIVDAALAGHDDLTASSFLQEGALSEQVRAGMETLLRLHRIGTSLHLAPVTLKFFAKHQAGFGVTSWGEQNQVALRRIAAVQALIKRRYRGEPLVALADIERLLADPARLSEVAAAVFGLEPVLTKDLSGALRMPEHPIDALFKLEKYVEMACKLSVDTAALAGIVSEDYGRASTASGAVLAGFRAKYPDEAVWKETIEPYQERVMEKKRDALIDYLLRGPDAKFPDASEMYKYFLIDGEVDGCFHTSRVVAASSSLQLYVHRIRMNLEKEPDGGLHVEPSLIPDEEWEWRQHYRVWEANRKIFLWPENYLDPTTRDDKTPLFEELESELLQQEITEQSVVDAYSNYLKAFEELANLRYSGSFHHYTEDEDSTGVTDIIYLFGATGGEAPTHYWREIRNLARSQEDELVSPQFGPWEKVETRIPTRHVSPVIYDGQLHVFWNEINTTSQNAVNDGKSRFIGYSHRYVLKFTSLRLDGQWTPPESVSLQGVSPAFAETNNSVDDPLAEKSEMDDFSAAVFDKFLPWFGTYGDPAISLDEVMRRILTPRYGIDAHTKAREGYTLNGFMWERPYVSPDLSYGHRLLVNCAGLLVRGAVDLFDRQVLRTNDTRHKISTGVGSPLLAYRSDIRSIMSRGFGRGLSQGAPDFSLLRRDSNTLKQISWSACPFDYPVAAALALNARDLTVFQRHYVDHGMPDSSQNVANNVSLDAGVWAVTGTPGEVVIETEDDMLLLLPDASGSNRYLLHRLGTTLVRDVARKLFTDGVDGLLATAHQIGLSEPAPEVSGPRTTDRTVRNPIANDAAYGIYFQEVFQHIPLLIAHHLNAQGKFEHAQRWYHYVFDPTSPEPPTDADAPPTDRNWKYRQFRGQEQTKLRSVLSDTAAIQKYREDPFNAHAIARLRVSAYQKAVVMRYIDNLLDWADERFTQFQMETVNEAMMLYVTAAEVLGPRPVQLGECGELSDNTRTYDKLKDLISRDGEFLLEVEELISASSPALPPVAASDGLTRPVFGLTAFLAFPLSKGLATDTGMLPVAVVGTPAITATMGGVTTGKTVVEATSIAQPVMSLTATKSVAADMIAGTMKSASAAKMSKGATGVFAPEGDGLGGGELGSYKAGTVKAAGKVTGGSMAGAIGAAIASRGLAVGVVPFAKAAVALDRTDGLVKSFALRQQFAFLGGHWKANGGRRIPSTLGDRFGRAVVRQVTAAFCIPRNENLDDYWNRVEDRIRKIRTCRDISGRKRKLSLFAPPIDPNLLARARAAGIALNDALGVLEGMIPHYRFPYLLAKAKEFAGTVQSFGAALQAALERKDAEELVRLQTAQQQQILALTTKAKIWEMEVAQANLEAAERHRTAVQNRQSHYAGLLDAGLSEWENAETIATHTASILNGAAATLEFISAVLHLIPQVGSPFAMKYGGLETGTAMDRIHGGMGMLARVAQSVAASAGLEARNERRREDWTFQRAQADDELDQIEKQIEAAHIGRDLAEQAITLHEKNIAQNDDLLEYHEDKFSGLGLYTWLASQLQRTYREAYNMANRMARYAEQAYRFEREDYASELLSGQHWEVSRAGLLAGNKLTLDLQYLEQRYIETDLPKRELIDHFFSLRQWDPKALIELRQKGECKFKIPELFFDLASPGDYRRRLRSVRVTIPAVAGPFVNVMATLSLNGSQIRPDPGADLQEAPRARVDSISTSSARNDAGSFELNFRGEKYVPFEGAGAVSDWSLSLPTAVRMFDYDTISDVILHLDYTASFDGVHRDVVQGVTTGLIASVQERLATDGFVRAFSLREEFPAQYKRLLAGEAVALEITSDHLPFFARFAIVSKASLIFTGGDEGSTGVQSVEFNGVSLGQPAADEKAGGQSIAIGIKGAAPWKHSFRVDGLSSSTATYLMFELRGQ